MKEEIISKLRAITSEEYEILNGNKDIMNVIYMNSNTIFDKSNTNSLVVDGYKTLEAGKLIQLRPHTRFMHFPPHSHNYVEVVYMCEGQTHHIINHKEVILNKGELLFLAQNATQEILPSNENDIAINFIILPEFFQQPLRMIGEEENLIRDFIISCLKNNEERIGYLHFKVADILPIQNLVENLIWTIINNQQNKRSILQITMGLLFLQLMNYTDKLSSSNHYEQDLLLSIYRYVEENYKDGQLTTLSKILHCDFLWLSRMIKKLTGKTYTELIQQKRLNQAIFLLHNTNLSIANIGYAVGYENLSYFYRIFKSKYSVSPKEYRKRK